MIGCVKFGSWLFFKNESLQVTLLKYGKRVDSCDSDSRNQCNPKIVCRMESMDASLLFLFGWTVNLSGFSDASLNTFLGRLSYLIKFSVHAKWIYVRFRKRIDLLMPSLKTYYLPYLGPFGGKLFPLEDPRTVDRLFLAECRISTPLEKWGKTPDRGHGFC